MKLTKNLGLSILILRLSLITVIFCFDHPFKNVEINGRIYLTSLNRKNLYRNLKFK